MMKSFLMIGQSNMAGRGFIQDVPPIYNEKLKCCVMEDGK
ncbi:Acetylxylan esterase related enzyme [Enterococcus sp. HSIEG1]|nr:Acetylxylan esterase related enzyme [Enterococcus sp. HSIEG1]